jgi:hypothetical protein
MTQIASSCMKNREMPKPPQQPCQGGWRILPDDLAFPGGRRFAGFEGAVGLVCFLST